MCRRMSRVGPILLVRRLITVRGTLRTRLGLRRCGTLLGRGGRGSNLLVGRLLRRLVLARCRGTTCLNVVWWLPALGCRL